MIMNEAMKRAVKAVDALSEEILPYDVSYDVGVKTIVRTVLSAVREPTSDMVAAVLGENASVEVDESDLRMVWKVMIDKLLKS